MATKLKTATLGCKVNQYETQFIREGLERAGYEEAQQDETAELCIVNTCTVTNEGDAKSRQLIRRLARENPDSRIVVMGCYATRAPEDVAELPNVTEVVTDKRELPDLLGRFGVIDIPNGISQFSDRHRAYVKVQDGCLLRCSYCIIPLVRPSLTSRPLEEILQEVQRLQENGYQEIVLTGIHLGHYGVDWNWDRPKQDWTRLADLVRAIMQLDGDFRVRLSSIEATEVTRELIAVMAEFPERICPHLHICLQSGSDAILRRMKRRWSAQLFVDRCQLVRETLDEPAFTTDVIVGFPGETEADFEATCRIVEEVGFSKIHNFPFSARRGTPAAEMTDVVSKQVKKQRGQQLAQLEQQQRGHYFQRLVGRQLQVLVESAVANQPGWLQGTSARYATVRFPGPAEWIGQLISVEAEQSENDWILARSLASLSSLA
ncbi:MAG: tRNA (N(6)-L-threonylcarbamoyladenosine(37)-C(2))-methylthiotransferase MtaB [Planctomycetota bacterium]|nr:tRNA (N(6)-L-threonylcarbamoyladenosine(37)-C(2))-methylthiotransferase MtaB [Planctomycetota bacterium]